MKRVGFLSAIVLIIAFLLFAFSGASGLDAASFKVFNDSSGIFVTKTSGNSVMIKNVKSSSSYNYDFEDNVVAHCVAGGKLYAATYTNQSGIVIINTAKDGEFCGEIMINSSQINRNMQMSADENERIYLLNRQNKIEIYDKNGSLIRKTDDIFHSIISLNGKVYAANNSGIFKIDKSAETEVCACAIKASIYSVSDSFIGDGLGSVYNIKNGRKILALNDYKACKFGETENYIVNLKGDCLIAYDKQNGELIRTYSAGFEPLAICADKNKIFLIKNDNQISVKAYYESEILPQKEAQSSKNIALADIDFGSYKVKGKYIYLSAGTSRTAFKKTVSYSGYKLSLSKRRGLGTGTKISFSNGNKTYTYTVIVKGDITGTGNVNSRDLNSLFKHLLGEEKIKGIYKTAADINGDGKLNNIDLVLTDRKIKAA